MSQGKCTLLKPVDNLTGNFFLFSQYAQDLTKQYANPDSYRCVPSKYIAMNLDYTTIPGNTDEELAKYLGEVFQNYYENSCTFLRSTLGTDWKPEDALTLLFQTLERYAFLCVEERSEEFPNGLRNRIEDTSETSNGTQTQTYGAVSGISDAIQYIGDINIYSHDDLDNGIGYNEIYCYIPNEAKCMDYRLSSLPLGISYEYDSDYIQGYEQMTSYNFLDWLVESGISGWNYIDNTGTVNSYGLGVFGTPLNKYVLLPQCLQENEDSNDSPRIDPETGKELDKFPINTIVVLYDIVEKLPAGGSRILHKNIPLGIYFAGKLTINNGTLDMTNIITKYVDSGQIYNQGTSYGLRICTRFLSTPNSTEVIETTTNGSTNVAEMAPVLEKMGETLVAVEDILDDKDKLYQMLKEHLAQFKDNKVNVPYTRQLGNKKYWFVNGKNTGAIAQYEYTDPEDIISRVLQLVFADVFTKQEISDILQNYVTRNELQTTLNDYTTRTYVDTELENLKRELLVYLQGE